MTQIIACEMLKDELELAMEVTGISYPVIWMEKGLHEFPQKLRNALQQQLDGLPQDCGTVLLAMALCGGALDGLTSARATLIAPRFDDCIRMLLSHEPGSWNTAEASSFYFTGQWLSSDGYILREHAAYYQRYGEKKAKKIIRMMLANYKGYRMVDTGAYDLSLYEEQAKADAQQLELAYDVVPGTIRVLEKLLRQDVDDEFCVAGPGEKLTQRMFLHL